MPRIMKEILIEEKRPICRPNGRWIKSMDEVWIEKETTGKEP